MATIRQQLEALTEEFERTIQHAEFIAGGRKGMSAPYLGDFANAAMFPSVVNTMRRWVRNNRLALEAEAPDSMEKERDDAVLLAVLAEDELVVLKNENADLKARIADIIENHPEHRRRDD